METPKAENSNRKAVEHQQIHDNEGKNEQYEESDSFSDFDQFDGATKNLMTLAKDGHVSFEEF